MANNIFLISLSVVISLVTWVSTLTVGILLIIRGKKNQTGGFIIKGWIIIIIGFVIGFSAFLPGAAFLYVERLWFKELGHIQVFWKMITLPWTLFVKYFLIAGGFLAGNFFLAQRLCPMPGGFKRWSTGKTGLVHKRMLFIIILASIVMASVMIPLWDDFLRNYNREPFFALKSGANEIIRDPQFNRDVSYYLFTLPIRNFLSLWTKVLFWIALISIGLLYRHYRHRDTQSRIYVAKRGIIHISALWILVLASSIWRSWVNIHRLVYSQRSLKGALYGAGYTDVHIQIPSYYIYMIAVLLVALAVLINIRLKRRYLVTIPIAVWVISYVVLIWFFPSLYQYIKVSPNESNLERDYIIRNIEYTRMGYELDKTMVSEIIPEVATLERIKNHPGTLKNVQLWDRRAVRDTLSQIQVFRPYYTFWDVDADRYHLVDPATGQPDYRQVMIAARELDINKIQSRTWVTKRLIYTHGYGVCLGPVNQFTPEGLPYLWVRSIPIDASYPELNVTRPEIYYGEVNTEYVFVKTSQKEFDYPEMARPDGAEDHYTTYEGDGGIPLKSIFRRFMMAIRFWDFRIVISDHLKPDSRAMFHRNIVDRVKHIAPFLLYDKDPYIVIGNSGRLWWVIDAYVNSKHYPYSKPYNNKFNYIRNPLKAVIDAYDGKVEFYIWDEKEPICKVYKKAFPNLFKSGKDIPDGLEKHSRYPDDLTTIQAEMYCVYHMRDPQTFYARGDQWELPYEVYYQNRREPMVPLYIMIQLPGDTTQEFVSIIPLTPAPTEKRPNMVAWMAVRNDKQNYGQIMVYIFPKGQTIPGPAQIESRIDTNPEMSEKLTLWNEGGSQVIRGNLLTIPVDSALFYVEPLYLKTEITNMPLLTQVIVAAGDKVAWAKNFDMAMEKVFEVGEMSEEPATAVAKEDKKEEKKPELVKAQSSQSEARSLITIINSAKEKYSKYISQIQSGDTANASKTLEELGKDLDDLEKYKKLLGG